MNRELAIDTLVISVLKDSAETLLRLDEEDADTLLSVLRVIEYYSIPTDYETYYAENQSRIDKVLGVKNLPANTFTITCVNENIDGSADIEVEMGPDMKDKVLEAGLNFLLMKAILGGTTENILDWATRGKESVESNIETVYT
jgi:hypothetical protein